MKKRRLIVSLAVLLSLFGSLPGAVFAASAPASSFTCTGTLASPEVIPPGTYQSLTVPAGTFCTITSGTVTVLGGITILGNGALQANTSGTTVDVSGGITVGSGGVLALGCAPSDPCPLGPTKDTVRGGIRADNALGVLLHGDTVLGHVSIVGGGGGIPPAPSPIFAAMFGFPLPFSAIEGNTISGGITVSDLKTVWLGFHRNQINGNLTLLNSAIADPFQSNPGLIEMSANNIHGDLVCYGNSGVWEDKPEGGTFNTVTGQALGQCASLVP